MLVQNNVSDHLETRTVYYSGSDQLKEGYALCYDTAASLTATDPKTRLGNQVVKPATAHLLAFCGFLAPQSHNKTGPCMVDVFVPRKGALVKAWTHANMTKFTSSLKLADADYGLVADADATLNLQTVAVPAETVDTSATAALKTVKFH